MNAPVDRNTKILALWLFVTAGAVFCMVIIGAITRLTESGLSMVEWRPLIGAIPPLNAQQWQHVFDLYKATPEFQKKNFWMGLEDFQIIFFWEWLHRLWGRLIGLIYGLPLLYFWWRGRIPQGYGWPLFGLLILGGLQGALGWYMVKSGLIDIPAVSHYRLAAHLSVAFLIFCLLIWTGMDLIRRASAQPPSPPTSARCARILFTHGLAVMACLIVTICWGAFTAGLDAGLLYPEFPLMGGRVIPPDMWHLTPAWINIFENPASVQFTHRILGVTMGLMVWGWWVHAQMRQQTSNWLHAASVMVLLQIMLGIVTLLSGVNIILAAAHQAGAVILLGLITLALFDLKWKAEHDPAKFVTAAAFRP